MKDTSFVPGFFTRHPTMTSIWEQGIQICGRFLIAPLLDNPKIFALDRKTQFNINLTELYITILTFWSNLQSPGSVE